MSAFTIRLIRIGISALVFALLSLCGWRTHRFIQIFFDHPGILLDQTAVLEAHHATPKDTRIAVIPRITHQIFHSWTHPAETSLPLDWAATRQTCLDLNPDWEHKLWTVEDSHDFIINEYPWFLATYNSYGHPVQRIDALRYFLMRHFGGIYIDLDNGCDADLEPLRYYPAWVTDGGHGVLSNNILGATPNHPFWHLMTDNLRSYAWRYPLPYLTIVYASGQWFLTAMWNKYHRGLTADQPPLIRISMDGRPGAPAWVFFTHTRGGTWDNWDNRLFGWIGDHLLLASLAVTLSLGCVITVVWALARTFTTIKSRHGPKYVPLSSSQD
ncbi:hypothetical protein LTR95_009399 [Oleoguttula sp. CCFEE 5521]